MSLQVVTAEVFPMVHGPFLFQIFHTFEIKLRVSAETPQTLFHDALRHLKVKDIEE